jgi:hypothetical protein
VDDPRRWSGKRFTPYMAAPRPRRVVLYCKEELHHEPYRIQYSPHDPQPPSRSAAAPHPVHGSAPVGVSSAPAVHNRHSAATTPLRTTGAGGRPPPVSVSSGYRTASRRSRFFKSTQHPYSRTAPACGRYRFGCVVTTWVIPVAPSVVRCCLYVDCDSTHGWCGVVVVILPPLPVYAVLRHDPHPQRPATP